MLFSSKCRECLRGVCRGLGGGICTDMHCGGGRGGGGGGSIDAGGGGWGWRCPGESGIPGRLYQ